jgi:membrane associated rhomboid family serine protease
MPSESDSETGIATQIFWNPVIQTLTIMSLVSIIGWTAFMGAGGVIEPFVLTAPLNEHPESIILSIYAHTGTQHLISNAILIGVVGGIISFSSSWLRFHLFFILSGSISGISQLVIMEYYGTALPALGASGAGFALLGYLVVANPIGDYLSGRAIVGLIIVGASALTIYFSPSGSGIMAHFSGAVVGMIAGRFHLLNAE